MPRAELHQRFVEEFGRGDVDLEHIKALCSRKRWNTGRTGCFAAGHEPANKGRKGYCAPGSEKGWFKKGTLNGTARDRLKPIGFERLSKEGYVERKIHNGMPLQSRWRAVHLIEWERANGPLPKGWCLKCLDANRQNTDPSNWLAIPRALLPRLAGRWTLPYDQAEPEIRPLVLAAAQLLHRASERAKA